MRENQLNELQGTSILTKSFFNKLIRRIECTKPLAGSGVTIKQEENGILISGGVSVGGGVPAGFTTITLNVCLNGTAVTIEVLGKVPN